MGKVEYIMDLKEFEKLLIDCNIKTNIELADRCNIDRNTVGKIRKGLEQPSSNVMYKLAEGLNMSPEMAGRIFLAATYVLRKLVIRLTGGEEVENNIVFLETDDKKTDALLYTAIYDEIARLKNCRSKKERQAIRNFILESYSMLKQNHSPMK